MRRNTFLDGQAALLLVGSALLAVGLALPGNASLQPVSASLQPVNAALQPVNAALQPVNAALQSTGGEDPVPPTTQADPSRTPFASLGNADSNGQMIAVTGIDLTGTSILYLVDTEKKQLAIYQATGGSESMQGVKLVGARRIDLDLQLEGFNDRSQYPYDELEQRFAKIRGGAATGK